MSTPVNPLRTQNSATYMHFLVAFKYAEDAFNMEKFNPVDINIGDSIPDVGPNVVIINEFEDHTYTISEAVWNFDFIPKLHVSLSSSVGKIIISDKTVPYSFLNFLRNNVLETIDEEGEMSLSHVTFVLKTFFILNDVEDFDADKNIQVNPYYFNIDSIESVPSKGGKKRQITPSSHIIHAIGASNTTGLLRSFSSLYQMDITHKDGNIHDQIPSGTGKNIKLRTRNEENNTNDSDRKNRLDKSKPMLTLKDMFDGFETDLNQQKYVHKAQLQQWLREIRTDDHKDKILVSPKQTKPPETEELPIDFVIDLDPIYENYPVNNRNMPFEQPDVEQDKVGIRVFPIRTGNTLYETIERIMILSKKIGEDAIGETKKSFKTTITAFRKKTNRYEINIKIRRYELPKNELVKNTGEDSVDVDSSLEFFVNDPNEKDTDIISFKSHINYEVGDRMLERQNEEEIGAGIVYADREQGTAERRPDLSFFHTLYSGVRPMISSNNIDGLESAQKAGDIFNLMDMYTYIQTTHYQMVILGNPLLLSDINRNPLDVIKDEEGNFNYYSKPETTPMYTKLRIFQKSYDINNPDLDNKFYYDNFYHVTQVVNMFGIIGGKRSFYQNLLLRRSNDLI